jgi:hypothetical protein
MDQMHQFETLLEDSGVHRLLGNTLPTEPIYQEFLTTEQVYNRRYTAEKPLLVRCAEDPVRYKPFFQAFALPLSYEFRMLILRLLEGNAVERLSVKHEDGKISMDVSLEKDPTNEPIHSENPFDYFVIARLSVMESEAGATLMGFRSWKVPERESA